MSPLEQTYRRALRWSPSKWRASNEDAVLGTLLDVADSNNSTAPSRQETASLVWRGFGARITAIGQIVPRHHAASVALGLAAMMALADLLTNSLRLWSPPAGIAVGATQAFGPLSSYREGPEAVLDLLWIGALVAALVGASSLARILAALSVPVAALTMFSSFEHEVSMGRLELLFTLLAIAVVAGRPGATRRMRLVTAATTIVGSAVLLVELVAGQAWRWVPQDVDYLNFNGMLSWLCLSVLAALGLAGLLAFRRRRAWAGAVLLALTPWMIVCTLGAIASIPQPQVLTGFIVIVGISLILIAALASANTPTRPSKAVTA